MMNQRTTAQKMKFSTKDFFSQCDPHLRKKSLMQKFIFCAVNLARDEYAERVECG